MSKEEEFKKQLQDLLENKSFPFEEKDWNSARKVIDAQRRKKRRLPFILFFAGLCTMAVLLWPEAESSPATSVDHLRSSTNSSSVTEQSSVPAITNTPASDPVGTERKKFSKLSQPVDHPENHDTEHNKEAIKASEVASSAASTVEKESPLAAPPSETFASQEPITALPAVPVVMESTAVASAEPEKQTKDLPAELLPVVAPGVQDTLTTSLSSLPSTLKNTSPSYDSTVVTPDKENAVNKDFKKKVHISAEGGCNVLFGWTGAKGSEGRSINPVLGLNYHGQVSDQLECTAGFNLTTIRGLNAYSDTSRITKYGFGEESEVTVISPKTLYYINFPLRLMWNFNLKQSAGFNLEPGYLVNASSEVETYVESLDYTAQGVKREFGYTQGLATFNLQFGLFYRQRIFERFYLQPEVFLGLKDLKNNELFRSEVSERSSGIKITLLYSLLHR